MPDLTAHNAYTCMTNRRWETDVMGDSGVPYVVRYEFRPAGPVQYDWTCTCRAFQYYFETDGYCKHIKRVIAEDKRCGWNEALDPHFTPDCPDNDCIHVNPHCGVCPKCGGPTECVRVAV